MLDRFNGFFLLGIQKSDLKLNTYHLPCVIASLRNFHGQVDVAAYRIQLVGFEKVSFLEVIVFEQQCILFAVRQNAISKTINAPDVSLVYPLEHGHTVLGIK
ncbi:MAG: hypothetical protein IPN95_31430 [Bacteroidetes bacterium]|nr:hypothetical protein [Bacteroidota bacterium]